MRRVGPVLLGADVHHDRLAVLVVLVAGRTAGLRRYLEGQHVVAGQLEIDSLRNRAEVGDEGRLLFAVGCNGTTQGTAILLHATRVVPRPGECPSRLWRGGRIDENFAGDIRRGRERKSELTTFCARAPSNAASPASQINDRATDKSTDVCLYAADVPICSTQFAAGRRVGATKASGKN